MPKGTGGLIAKPYWASLSLHKPRSLQEGSDKREIVNKF